MPNRCVAAGCGNIPSDSVSLFRFPKHPNVCGVWNIHVGSERGRTGIVETYLDHSRVDCFDEIPALKAIYAWLYNVTVC